MAVLWGIETQHEEAQKMTLEQIFDQFTKGSTGFCAAVETHCGLNISRDEIERIASSGQVKNAADFMNVWENADWWTDLNNDEDA